MPGLAFYGFSGSAALLPKPREKKLSPDAPTVTNLYLG